MYCDMEMADIRTTLTTLTLGDLIEVKIKAYNGIDNSTESPISTSIVKV